MRRSPASADRAGRASRSASTASARRRQLAVVVQHVRIPLAPLAGAPPGRVRRRVHEMRDVGRPCAPAATAPLPGRRTPRSARRASSSGGRRRAALRQPAEAQRAEALGHLDAIGGRRPGQVRRARRVGQKLRVVHPLRRARELQLEPRRRKRDDLVGALRRCRSSRDRPAGRTSASIESRCRRRARSAVPPRASGPSRSSCRRRAPSG